MKPHLILAGTLAFLAPAAFAADGNFDRTLSVGAAPAMTISTGSGYIHVYSGSGNQIHIVGHVHVRSGWFGSGDDEDRVKQIVANPPVRQTGDNITIAFDHADSDFFRNVSIDYDVTAPRVTSLKAHTGSGDLEIGGIDNLVSAGSGSGSIHVDNIGPNARLDTGSGSIRATGVRGAATLHTGSGDLELDLTAAGDAMAQTGSGSIHIAGLNGGVRATSGSGSVEVAGNPTSEWRVQTGSGSVQLRPDASARFTVSADTGSGSIRVDRPIMMQGSLNHHHVSGTVNGGGPTLRVSTGSGSVSIH